MNRFPFSSRWPLLLPCAVLPIGLGLARPAHAQTELAPRPVTLSSDSLTLSVGERVLLPLQGVTRIITDDDEIARAFFQNGSPVLQGLAPGATVVEIYQASGMPRVLNIQVSASAISPLPAPVAPIEVAPPISPVEIPAPVSGEIEPLPQPDPNTSVAIAPARSQLMVALNAAAASADAGQIEFSVTYSNPGAKDAQNAEVKFPLDERISYVTGSATPDGIYDPVQRAVVWKLGKVPAKFEGGVLKLRVRPIETRAFAFTSEATIEDGQSGPVSSAQVRYSTATTPLLTVFALPDRFLAGRNGRKLVDVRGTELQSAVARLNQMGVVNGYADGMFRPGSSTLRAEYAVMTLNGLNLRDLRDLTQIKFVLGRRSTVGLFIQDSAGKRVANLVRNTTFEPGEHTEIWNGRTATGFAAPGRYTYVCTARDAANAKGEITTLRGFLNLVPQTPLQTEGTPGFSDVKTTDWYARYLAVGERQGLIFGFPDKTFRPKQPISRVEATAIVVRALGFSDLAREWGDKDVGFEDYATIPKWARGAVNVATTVAKTANGKTIMRGTKENQFQPMSDLRRDQAALIVQRLIDRETTRRVSISGAIAPGAKVTINSRQIEADGNGKFAFSFDLTTSVPITVAVLDTRGR